MRSKAVSCTFSFILVLLWSGAEASNRDVTSSNDINFNGSSNDSRNVNSATSIQQKLDSNPNQNPAECCYPGCGPFGGCCHPPSFGYPPCYPGPNPFGHFNPCYSYNCSNTATGTSNQTGNGFSFSCNCSCCNFNFCNKNGSGCAIILPLFQANNSCDPFGGYGIPCNFCNCPSNNGSVRFRPIYPPPGGLGPFGSPMPIGWNEPCFSPFCNNDGFGPHSGFFTPPGSYYNTFGSHSRYSSFSDRNGSVHRFSCSSIPSSSCNSSGKCVNGDCRFPSQKGFPS